MNVCKTILAILILVVSTAAAQEWGVVSSEEGDLVGNPSFPDAVVIFDLGEVVTERMNIRLERHTRIKLFSQQGIAQMTGITIKILHYDQLYDLEAQILRDGQVVQRYEQKAFEIRELEEWEISTFQFEDVQPGDIIEYRYKIDYYGGFDKLGPEVYFLFNQDKHYSERESKRRQIVEVDRLDGGPSNMRNIPTWYFDHTVFCLRSQFSVKLGADYDYIYLPVNVPIGQSEPEMERIILFGATAYKRYTWELTNISPYELQSGETVAPEVVRSGLHFNMFSSAGMGQNRMVRGGYSAEHWEYLGRNMQGYLQDYNSFTRSMQKQLSKLHDSDDSPEIRARKICDFVATNYIADTTNYSLRPTNSSLKDLYKKKRGKPFELNVMLVEMLRRAGFDAWPILISTADRLPFEQSGRFNHMLAMFELNGSTLFRDASTGSVTTDSLPAVSRVEKGVIIDYDDSRIVEIGAD